MKNFEIKDKEYIYLLKYFDGDITNLNLEDLKSLRKGKFKGQEVEVLDVKIYKFFKVSVDIKKKEPKKYAKMKFKGYADDWNGLPPLSNRKKIKEWVFVRKTRSKNGNLGFIKNEIGAEWARE